MTLSDSVKSIPLVGDVKAKLLEKVGIVSVKDMFFHVPFRYHDTSEVISIRDLILNGRGTVRARVVSVSSVKVRRYFIVNASIEDDTRAIKCVWFNQWYIKNQLVVGRHYLFDGKVSTRKGYPVLSSPQFELSIDPTEETLPVENVHLGRLTPHYELTEGLSSKWIRARIHAIKSSIDDIEEPLPSSVLADYNLLPLSAAIRQVHFPQGFEEIRSARNRLEMDEFIGMMMKFEDEHRKIGHKKAQKIEINDKNVERVLSRLDYSLTADQVSALSAILSDIGKEIPCNRLLNGDVGSGKTILSVIACYAAVLSGYTAVVLAPTTVLASQHYKTFTDILKTLDVPIQLLIAGESLKSFDKGQIIIATHAVLYEKQLPSNIGLVVIDEQHRFGVNQKEQLLNTKDECTPHVIMMSATPIPRSLAQIVYGDADISQIRSMPGNRLVVKTYYVEKEKREACYKWVAQHIRESSFTEQAFIVFPLVDESDKSLLKSATAQHKELSEKYFSDLKVGLIHGRVSDEEKFEVLKDFREKKYNILVATTVIEVGIDIPDASVIVVENAERFGLAQLHQLRGRVGRGRFQSYCYVISSDNVTKEESAGRRLTYFCAHNSGFDVAEYDLQTRGPGEVYGTIQSGIPKFKVANILNHENVLLARKIVKTYYKDIKRNFLFR